MTTKAKAAILTTHGNAVAAAVLEYVMAGPIGGLSIRLSMPDGKDTEALVLITPDDLRALVAAAVAAPAPTAMRSLAVPGPATPARRAARRPSASPADGGDEDEKTKWRRYSSKARAKRLAQGGVDHERLMTVLTHGGWKPEAAQEVIAGFGGAAGHARANRTPERAERKAPAAKGPIARARARASAKPRGKKAKAAKERSPSHPVGPAAEPDRRAAPPEREAPAAPAPAPAAPKAAEVKAAPAPAPEQKPAAIVAAAPAPVAAAKPPEPKPAPKPEPVVEYDDAPANAPIFVDEVEGKLLERKAIEEKPRSLEERRARAAAAQEKLAKMRAARGER